MDRKSVLVNTLKDSNYGLSLFSEEEINDLEDRIILEGKRPYVVCLVRNKRILLKPEEVVRQLFLARLINKYHYSTDRIGIEHPVHFGREIKSADLVIFDKDRPRVEYIVVELKKPRLFDGKSQLRSYCNATGAPIGVWTNGAQISHYHRKDPNYFEDITDIPASGESLEDILKERFTLKDLIIKDKIPNEGKSLKQIILEMEDEVLANAGVDVFEEVFKLIFTKLFDELQSKSDKDYLYNRVLRTELSESGYRDYQRVKDILANQDDTNFRVLEFRNTGQSESELKGKIQTLFDKAKKQWGGIFAEESKIELTPSHLSVCVSSLQDIKLFNTNLQVVDEAFEYLVNKSARGEKGQYFTPRHVIDMCVKMLNPQKGESMIDTAAGSCGFPVHVIFYLFDSLFYGLTEDDKEYVEKIFGIDFDEKVVRVARTLNLIAGDGNTNVLHLNSLDYDRWGENFGNRNWLETYSKGLKNLEKLSMDKGYKNFNFDILMTNPPFAGDIKESRIIHKYQLGYNEKKKPKPKVGRDILFIERDINFLKPGGRMAVVLPQGRFNNSSDKDIREFISEHGRILAVVGLDVNTFKPHTGTKTSVLFFQKWNDDISVGPICKKVDDYPIFFATSEKSGKDNSGDYIFVKNKFGKPSVDRNGHLIIDHDLHNHDLKNENSGELSNGIAESFIKWAKKEKLSFWSN